MAEGLKSPQGALNSNETFLDNAPNLSFLFILHGDKFIMQNTLGRLDEHILELDNNEYFALSGSFNMFDGRGNSGCFGLCSVLNLLENFANSCIQIRGNEKTKNMNE